MSEFPKIISVDDHVVEPAHLWQDRLPAEDARAGPARRAGAVGRLLARRRRDLQAGDDRRRHVGRLLAVRGPLDLRAQAARRDPARRDARRRRQPFRSVEDVHRRDDLRRDATRVLRAESAHRRPRARGRRRLDRVPDVSAVLRADVHGRQRSRARVGMRARLQRLDDRRLVRGLRRPPDPAVPDPALGRRARGRRGRSATRPAARVRSASARSRRTSACRASTPGTGIRCSRSARRRARRCACTSVRRRRCRPLRPTRRPRPTSCCRSTTRWRRSPTSCSPECSCASRS